MNLTFNTGVGITDTELVLAVWTVVLRWTCTVVPCNKKNYQYSFNSLNYHVYLLDIMFVNHNMQN